MEFDFNKHIDNIFTKDDIHHYFFNHIDYCIFSFDKEGNIHEVNNFFLKNLGYKRKEVVGKNIKEFIHEEDADQALDIMRESIENKTFLDGESSHKNRWINKDGDYVTLEWEEGDALFFNNYYICYAKIWKD